MYLLKYSPIVVSFVFFLFCADKVKHGAPVTVQPKLSDYKILDFKKAKAGVLKPQTGFRYQLQSPLFSDYALKYRTLHLPEGTRGVYHDDDIFALPIGTIITKTFAFPADLRTPKQDVELIETRLLIHNPNGWEAYPYVWNEDKTEAFLKPGGRVRPLKFINKAGQTVDFFYTVPSKNQCGTCHQTYEAGTQTIQPIGIKARHLNREAHIAGVKQNQLDYMKTAGLVAGMPGSYPKLADFNDASAGVTERARAYMDINCGHCHNPKASSGVNSNLMLDIHTDDPELLGVCKVPASAGKGGGGFKYDIVPGKPGESVLYYRTATKEPGAMMPQLGRALTHTEGAKIIFDWIRAMPAKSCDSI